MDCVFCDRNWSQDEFADLPSVLRDAPLSELSGMRAVLGGGEPTLHPELPQLLRGLRKEGVRRVALRTNGAWASRTPPIGILKGAGLTDVSLLFISHEPAVFNRLSRRKDAFDTVMQGAKNLYEAGVRIVLRVPLIRPTLPTLDQTLQAIPSLFPKVRRIELVHLDIDDPEMQVHRDEINAKFPFGSEHPWPNVPPLVLDPGPGVPLCWQSEMAQWRISPDTPTANRNYTDACERCFAKHACPGVMRGYEARYGGDVVTPYEVEEYVAEPLPASEVSEVGGFVDADGDVPRFESVKGVTYECNAQAQDDSSIASVRLRIGHECNRRCNFCFIPHHEKSVQDYDIESSINAAVEEGARELVLTGGEPTLQKGLANYIRQARDGGVRRIVLQTNAIRLADPDFCQELVDAGLTNVVISLHAHKDEVLQEITSAPNTVPKIMRGIDNLHAAGLKMSVTHVINPYNYMHLPDFVRCLAEEHHVKRFCFIFATPMAAPMARKELIVRFSDAAPYLMEALDYCIEHGLIVDGPALKCGVPHCILRGEPKYIVDAVPIPDANRTDDWMRVPACGECTLKTQCYGVRRLYVWLYGIEEFKPVTEPGKLAENFAPRADIIPASNIVRRARTQVARRTRHDAAQLVETARVAVGLSAEQVARVVAAFDEHVFTLGEGLAQGFRVRHGDPAKASVGSLELGLDVSLASCREGALMRALRLAALGLPVSGAHGGIAWNAAAFDNAGTEIGVVDDDALASIVRQYVAALGASLPPGAQDYLTPHTSLRWPVVEDAWESGTTRSVGLLRRTLEGELAELRMTSVESAVAAALWALGRQSAPAPVIRYAVWGYGRAGRRFAELFDRVSLMDGSRKRRPVLVGCADSEHAWVDPRGLEHERISAFKARNGVLPVGSASAPDAVLYQESDLLVLSGRGSAFDVQSARRVGAKVVLDLTGEIDARVERALEEAGVAFIPALIATSGPLVLADLERAGLEGLSVESVRAAIEERVHALLDRVSRLRCAHPMSSMEAVVGVGLAALSGASLPGASAESLPARAQVAARSSESG